MPTYDYVCDACGHAFAEFQTMSAARLTTCPSCKKRKLRRLIGAGAGIVFKGSGFYITDYARKGQAPAEGAAGSGEGKGAEAAKPAAEGAKGTGTGAAEGKGKGEGKGEGKGKGEGTKGEGGKAAAKKSGKGT